MIRQQKHLVLHVVGKKEDDKEKRDSTMTSPPPSLFSLFQRFLQKSQLVFCLPMKAREISLFFSLLLFSFLYSLIHSSRMNTYRKKK